MLPAGIIFTGGVSKTDGIDAFALDVLDLPARVSAPLDANRMPPGRDTQEYSSAAGIIRYILEKERDPFRYLDNPAIIKSAADDGQKQHLFGPEPIIKIPGNKNNGSGSSIDIGGTVTKFIKELF